MKLNRVFVAQLPFTNAPKGTMYVRKIDDKNYQVRAPKLGSISLYHSSYCEARPWHLITTGLLFATLEEGFAAIEEIVKNWDKPQEPEMRSSYNLDNACYPD